MKCKLLWVRFILVEDVGAYFVSLPKYAIRNTQYGQLFKLIQDAAHIITLLG